ncbi:MAG: sulfite exporter TauE/SafE family protein [Leptospiraceae bacterium]|nr:sulfite exporter TauE/SafE family protein [Leptospiraceae bacterium]
MYELVYSFLFFLVAISYSSVGHGGASGYLAILSLFLNNDKEISSTSLCFNLAVSLIGFFRFHSKHETNWNFSLPLLIPSMTTSFLASSFSFPSNVVRLIMGLTLLFSGSRILWESSLVVKNTQEPKLFIKLIIGSIIGFLSGIIGVGGGIFLSPVILILQWKTLKESASTVAIFIFLNSFTGVLGRIYGNKFMITESISYILPAIFGAILGSYLGSSKLTENLLRKILSIIILFAGIKLLIK